MVALLIVIEAFVAGHWIDLTDPVSLSWRYGRRAAETAVRDCQVLCMGDSLVKHGLVPSVIERTSGLKAVNLSAAPRTAPDLSPPPPGVDSGARPKALIVNAKPAVLLGGPEFTARPWQEVLSVGDAIEMLQITRNAPFVASALVGRLLPSLRVAGDSVHRDGRVPGEIDRIRSINPVLWRNWSVNGGRTASAVPAYRGELSGEVKRQLYTDIFYVDPANAEAIERTLTLAAGCRIPVFWVLFPLTGLQSLPDSSGAETLHKEFLKSFVRLLRNGHGARRPPLGLSRRILRRRHAPESPRGHSP